MKIKRCVEKRSILWPVELALFLKAKQNKLTCKICLTTYWYCISPLLTVTTKRYITHLYAMEMYLSLFCIIMTAW